MKNFKLIKGVEATPLKKLNESKALKNPDKYVFEGVFTQCSVPGHVVVNRNNRIYTEKECLRHLGYLRETIKENGGHLLGELDHPEGRFDIQMKEASHMITDLWYDDATHCVMGRLEVLDTPNGKTLKSLIDAGFPLYVSSRAAGDVNEKTKEVEIAQIFTYDVVCTPGFKEARLERVNESLLTDKALKYINESVSAAKEVKNKDIEVPYLIINENEIAAFNNTRISDVNKPLYEDEDVSENDKQEKIDGQDVLNDVKSFYPTMNTSGKKADDINEDDDDKEKNSDDKEKDSDDNNEKESDDKKDDKKELTDSEKEENRDLILNIVGLDNDGEPVGNSANDSENSEKENKKDDIESIEGVKKNKDEDDKKDGDKDDKENKDEDKMEENAETKEKNDKLSAAADKKVENLKKDTKENLAEIDSILDSVKKAEDVKESIIRRYPFSISLSESNFAKFAQLRPNQKKRCAEFIEEHDIFDIRAINELWMTPLREDKKMQQNWLRLASQSDIDLYVAAPVEVQNAIEENAQLFVLDTQEEVDNFWNRTGLRQAAYQKAMNEQAVNNFRNSFGDNENSRKNPLNETCGYNIDDFIAMTERMMKD